MRQELLSHRKMSDRITEGSLEVEDSSPPEPPDVDISVVEDQAPKTRVRVRRLFNEVKDEGRQINGLGPLTKDKMKVRKCLRL